MFLYDSFDSKFDEHRPSSFRVNRQPSAKSTFTFFKKEGYHRLPIRGNISATTTEIEKGHCAITLCY